MPSTLIAHEPSCLNIDMACLSEDRVTDKGIFQDVAAGFTLFLSGKPSTDRGLSCVGNMVKNAITSKLETALMFHSDH